MTCVWQSNSPGSTARPAQSTRSSPSRPGPTSTMSPSSTTTSASARAAPVPSKTAPPANSILVTSRSSWIARAYTLPRRSGFGRALHDLEPVPERVERVEPPVAGDRGLLVHLDPGRLDPAAKPVQALHQERRMGLLGRVEGLLHPEVDLDPAAPEPAAATA